MAKSTVEFKSLRDSVKSKIADLSRPGVKQTDAVVNARKKMEAMLLASEGSCIQMFVEIESE
jgi:hypothetical protein